MNKTAIILGATGLTGGFLLEQLIADKNYSKIKLFSRSSADEKSEKVEEFLVDLLELENQKEAFKADVVFCCIGTTAAKTKDKKKYKAIDYGIPVTAAKLSKENNIETFVVLSSIGADAKSNTFYTKVKGEMENAVLKQNISNTFILRPSMIGGKRDEFRLREKIGKVFMKILKPLFFGGLKKYRIIHPKTIANCMQILANQKAEKSIFISNEIEEISKSN